MITKNTDSNLKFTVNRNFKSAYQNLLVLVLTREIWLNFVQRNPKSVADYRTVRRIRLIRGFGDAGMKIRKWQSTKVEPGGVTKPPKMR